MFILKGDSQILKITITRTHAGLKMRAHLLYVVIAGVCRCLCFVIEFGLINYKWWVLN